jgi:hypothetical protein
MFGFWRKADGAANATIPPMRVDHLSPHLKRDLNLPEDQAFFAPESIRNWKYPLYPSF